MSSENKKLIKEYAEALLIAVLLAFVIRSFVIEPYRIPSKSMVPNLLVGDHIFVNKFSYGLRFPWTKKWLVEFEGPKRGEVIVFIYPQNESQSFIKRVIGVPGDHIQIKNDTLWVNNTKATHEDYNIKGIDPDNRRSLIIPEAQASHLPQKLQEIPFYKGYKNYQIKVENLLGHEHIIQRSRFMPNLGEEDIVVPEGYYFVMGDNRDQSSDSRVWGLVPRENLKGRALFIWLSLDSDLGGVRWGRFFKGIF